MTRLRVSFFLSILLSFPLIASAAITEYRLLLDVDNNAATGCVVSAMPGTDQIFTTVVEDDGTTASVTRTFRRVCESGILGPEIDVETTGWPAAFQASSGQTVVETRIRFSEIAGSDTSIPHDMHIAVEAVRGASSHTALTRPNGSVVLFPESLGRRRVIEPRGEPRIFILDGLTEDWSGIDLLFEGLASGGTPGLRLLNVYAFPDVHSNWFYLRFDANLSTDAPFANNDQYRREPGEDLSVAAPGVLANDGDPNGLPLTAMPVSSATRGVVTLNSDGSFTYTPTNPASTEADSFEYRASNGSKQSNTATVRISVDAEGNTNPRAVADAYNTNEDTQLNVAAPGVLQNDTDADGDSLTATLLSSPSHGTVVLNADGGFTYTPATNFFGTDTFTYSVTDGQGDASATVTITILSQNDAPHVRPDTFSIAENSANGTAVGTVDVSDVDSSDTHTFSITGGNGDGAFAINASTGAITVADGSVLNFEATQQYVLTVRATDSGSPARSDSAEITINVLDANDAPVATPQTLSTDEDTALPLVLAGTDEDGDTLSFTVTTAPANGTVSGTGANRTYTPNANFNGSDSFAFVVSDGADSSAPATVTITVNPINDPPTFALSGDANVNEDSGPHASAVAVAITEGPADEAAQNVSFVVTNDANTLFSVQPSIAPDGTLTFTPALNANGTATVTVTAVDDGGGAAPHDNTSAPATFTINVAPVNDAPAFTAGSDVTVLDTAGLHTVGGWATGLSAGPANESGQSLDFIVANDSPALFTIAPSVAPDGTLTFTPAPGQDGIATVTVQIHDNGGTANGGVDTSAPQTLQITVEKIPAITSGNATTFVVGQPGAFLVTTSGRPRPDIAQGGVLPAGVTFVDGSGPTQGTGTLSGTPAPLTGGVYPLTFQATNVHGSSPVQNFTLTVHEAPSITSTDTATFTQGLAGSFTVTTTGFPDPALALSGTVPAGLSFVDNGDGTATVSGTPTAAGGSYSGLTITASNGVGTDAVQPFTIIINEAPVITSAASTGFTAGVAGSFTVTTTGFPAPSLALTGALPSGITFTDNGNGTATLGGVAANGSGGVYSVTITATNAAGSDPQTFTITVCNQIAVTNPANASASAGVSFSETFTESGAVGGATFTTASTLPAGLTLSTTGVLSGTPTEIGTFPIVVMVTDGNGCTGTGSTYNLVVGCPTITVTNPSNSTGTAASPFSETFTQSGGVGAVTISTSSTLPAGLTLATNGVLSGTPTQTGTFPIVVTATDANGCTGTSSTYNLVIGCQIITVTNPANGNGTAGAPFTETFTQSGAIGSATFTLASGTLPAGLTLASNGVLSGTPTQTGTFPITVTATDANGCTGTSATYTIVIACQTISVFVPANASGTVSAAFSETFTQSGAIGSATFTTVSTLPAGLTLAANGVLSGTPTQTGTFPIVVTVTDANGCTGTSATYNLVIACQIITVNNPANTNGTVSAGFNEQFTQSGAVGAVTFTTTSTLPAGLTLAADGTLSGTPTETGTFPIDVTVTDANGCTGTNTTYTLVIACQTITVDNPANANGTASSAFSETFTQTGAIGSATFTTSSTLPAGLTLAANGVLSGTPTQTGTFPIVVTVTDANGCTGTSATYNLVIACQTITVTNPANANGTASSAFSETFTQTGAIGSATFTTSSTLPAGVTLAANGVLSGTPTQTGTFPIVVTVTDANGCTGTSATYNLVIACQTITVTEPSNGNGTAAAPFSETFTQAGAIGTATFSLATGTLPAGLTLQSNGTLDGTPTQTGTFPITVTVTDANGCTGTSATYTIVIACQTITVNNPANAAGTVSSAFNEAFTQLGAIGTATFTTSSTLPAGLVLQADGTLTGTPTEDGTFPIVVTVTDANGCTGTSATYNLVIGCQVITVTNPVNTGGTVNAPFSESFSQTAAVGGATFTLASGVLPAGLTLAADGTLSGTPTEDGTFPIEVLVTDGNGCTGTSPVYTLVIACQTITVTNPSNATVQAGSPFSETFIQTGAFGTATFTTASTLPAGLTLAANGVLSGTPSEFGTFPIVVTVTDANGCTGTGATYTLEVTCPVITVTNPANANGTASSPFSETFTQTGAIGSATFTTSSTLPAGLTLATNGVLSGTPTQTGTFPIVVTVTDANGCTGTSATYNLNIACQTITVTEPSNGNGTAAAAFSETFTQTGAIGTATFTLASGTLPAGLTLQSNGTLDGTPTQTGSFPITVTVTDANGCTGTSATYTIVIACQTITVTEPSNANGTVSSAFNESFTQLGAIGTATFTTASTLPAGLTLQTDGTLTGTPTEDGTFPIVVTVTDANGCTGTSATYNLVIGCQVITVTNPLNTGGTVNAAFSESFSQTDAVGGATFTLASGVLPAGLTLAADGTLSGTPTEDGTFPIEVLVTDGNGCTGTSPVYTLVIACQTITVTNPINASGTVSSAFNETFMQTGAVGTATFTTASTLPAGLTLAADGTLSGTPTEDGTFPIVVTVTDSNGCTGTSATYTLVIACQTINVTNPANANGTAGSAFSEMFSQTGAVGTATFTTSDTLPAGLTLQSNGTLDGTPTQTGSFPIVVTVTDSNGCTGTSATYTINIACQTITVTEPSNANGVAGSPFNETFTETGAIGGATFTLASGTLPAGLTLQTNGTLDGTPTQTGSFPITVTATDANGCTGTSATYTIVIACQTITVNNPANANGTAGSPFAETFTQTDAIGAVSYSLASGTLPAGLTLETDGDLVGTPTQTGSFPITVTVTDANGCTGTSATYTINIACQTITVNNPANANGTVNAAFFETFTQLAAIGSATFTTASTLPNGLTLETDGDLTGTPTEDGTFPIVVTVTDANGCTGTSATYNLVIACQTITVTNPSNASGTAGTSFTETFTKSDAVGTATFTTASTLPAGLLLQADGTLTGTPTDVGTFPIVVTVTDSNGCTGTGATYNLVIACQTIAVTNPTPTTIQAGTAADATYTFTATGILGTANWTVVGGALPTGITLNATSGQLEGSSTTQGSFPITVRVTDTNGCFDESDYTLDVICPAIAVGRTGGGSFPAGTFNVAYSGESFAASGGTGPYTFAVDSGTFPPGLTLNANGTISGTPTATGTFLFDVEATDVSACTGVQSFSIAINPSAGVDSYSTLVNNTQAVVTGGSTSSPATPFVPLTGTVLANDAPSGGVTAIATTVATTEGGSVTIAADGTYIYTPPLTLEATDSFNYTISSNTGGTGTPTQAIGTVNLTLSGRVWYVKNDLGVNGNGQSHSPFNTTSSFVNQARVSPDAPGDIIYIYNGDGTAVDQNGGIALLDNQQLIGEGVALLVNTHTLVAAGSSPLISNTGGAAVTLGNLNTVKGLTVTNATTHGIHGNAKNGFTGENLSITSNGGSGLFAQAMTGTILLTNTTISGNSGAGGLNVDGGTAVVTADSTNTISAPAAFAAVNVTNHDVGAVTLGAGISSGRITVTNNVSGTISFTGTQSLSTGGATAVSITGNSATTTVSFSGALGITTTVGSGFVATGGGTLNVSGTATISTGAAPSALNLNSMTVGGSGVTFNDVDAASATTAISLVNVNGTVAVNGGTITNGTTGISMQGASTNLSLAGVSITGPATGITNTTNFGTLTIGAGVNVSAATALNLTTGTLTGTFANVSSTGGTNGVNLNAVSGTWGTTAGALNGASGATFNVSGGSGQITWGANITQANGANAVTIAGSNSTIINFNGNVVSQTASTGLSISNSSGTYNFNGAGNVFSGAGGITIGPSQSGNISFSSGTSITTTGTAFNVNGSGGAVTAAIDYNGTINKTSAGILISVDNLDSPGTLDMSHSPAASGNISQNHASASGISVINSSSTNINIPNASITFQSSAAGFTASGNTGTIHLSGLALSGSGNKPGMLISGGGTINVNAGAGNASINLSGGTAATSNAINGTTTVFTGTLNLTNATITGNSNADVVTLGGGTLGGTGSTISGPQRALVLSAVALTNGAGMTSIASTGGANGISLTNVTGGPYTVGSGGNLSGNTGHAFLVSGGSATFTYAGNITQNTAGQRAVNISGITGGTMTLSGTIGSNGGAGISLAGTGGTITLSGQITLNNTGATFSASGTGLTVNVTHTANTIGATNPATGPAVSITNATIGASNVQFQSVRSSGGANGIVLTSTGSTGRFLITGNAGACSSAATCTGGAIQNTTGHGVALTSTFNPSFTRLYINNTSGSGVYGTDVTNFTYQFGYIDNSGTGLAAESSNIAFNLQVGGNENNLDGTVTITNNTLVNAYYHGVDIYNHAGTIANANISSNTITSTTSTATSKGTGIRLVAFGNASGAASVTAATVSNNTISNFPSGAGITAQGGNANAPGAPEGTFGVPNSATDKLTFSNNSISGASAANRMGTNAIQVSINGEGRGNWDIVNNTSITNIGGNVISTSVLGNSTATVEISGNVIDANHVPNFGGPIGISAGVGKTWGVTDVAVLTITIDGNNVSDTDGSGIQVRGTEGQGTLNVTISGNTVAAPVATALRSGIRVEAGGSTAGTDNDVCLSITGNTTFGSSDGFDTAPGISLRKQGTSTTVNAFGIEGMAATSSPGVENYVNGLNTSSSGTFGTGGTSLASATSGFSNCSSAP